MQAGIRTLLILTAVVICGCAKLNLMPFFDKEEARRKNVREALHGEGDHSRLIGDYIKIADSTLGMIRVQGIGLVDRLDGTGEDPPASPYRTQLLEDIRRHEVKDPQTLLRSSNTALVIVTAYIPPIVKKGDRIDIEVQLPQGTEATSLRGGWLMPCQLSEYALLGGQVKQGRDVVKAVGAVLIDALGQDSKNAAAGHRRGVIPGGGVYLGDDRHLKVGIGSEYRTVRMSSQIANRIGKRFHDYDAHGIQRPLATAKTDAFIDLIVHDRYRDNYPRYLQVIRHLPLTESPVEKHLRLQQLSEEIKFGPTAEKAALQLEAIGPESIPVLKAALSSADLEARFHAGVALAYLGNSDGIPALKESAAQEPAFRIFALAALSSMSDGAAAAALRDLMSSGSIETRYGAFRALQTMAPDDPFIQGVKMEGNFVLHPIESSAKALIHLTRRKQPEIVVFDERQEFQLPLVLRAGNRIVVRGSSAGDGVVVKRIAVGEAPRERTVSRRVVEVIKAASDLGAQYPDVVEMLIQAKNQHNLPGEIAIDELPRPGRTYRRPLASGASSSSSGTPAADSVQIGGSGLTPNLFEVDPVDRPLVPAEDREAELKELESQTKDSAPAAGSSPDENPTSLYVE